MADRPQLRDLIMKQNDILRRMFVLTPGTHVEARLRNALYNRLQVLSVSFHDRWPSGQLLSRVMNDVILRALQKKPKDRFQSAREMRDALERVLPPNLRKLHCGWATRQGALPKHLPASLFKISAHPELDRSREQ